MKNSIIVILGVAAIAFAVFAFQQRQENAFYREENKRLQQSVIKLTNQANTVRVEASKLRYIIEMEKKRSEQLMEEAKSKLKKK
jgi:hypothetical protein